MMIFKRLMVPYSLSHCFVCLVARASCPGQFFKPPHPPGYQSKIILLFLNYLIWRCINYKHNSSQIQLFSLSHCFVCLVAGVGGKLSRAVYLAPHPPGHKGTCISFLLILFILNYLSVEMYQL